jgi:hypothetical protein
MPEHPIEPDELTDELDAAVATQPEDDDPLAFVGDAADPPKDMGRPEGVAP